MRRYVSAGTAVRTTDIVTAWHFAASAMGALAVRQSVYLYSSSKFFGRKPGGSKKVGTSGSTTDGTTLTTPPTSSSSSSSSLSSGTSSTAVASSADEVVGGNGAVAKKITEEPNANPALVPGANSDVNSSSVRTSEKNAAATAAKKLRLRCPRKTMQSLTGRTPTPLLGEDTVRFGKQSQLGIRRSLTEGNVSLDLGEDEVVAERASITKLFMVSDSLASIFCALPQNQRSIDNYLKEVDRAVLPPTTSESNTNDVDDVSGNQKGRSGETSPRQKASVARREIAERILSEERANHTLCIHVRDMDQLVPPRHLLLNGEAPASVKASTDGVRRRKSQRSSKKLASATSTSLTSIERILALHEWQANALKKARESQERYKIPENYHAITRVRFHDPPQADLTVVQGSGCTKTVADVLATMDRNLKKEFSAEDDESSGVFDNLGIASSEIGETLLSKPFTLKPLLSVVASCIPRREPALGSRCGEETFFGTANSANTTITTTTTGATVTRKSRKLKKTDAASELTTKAAASTTMGEHMLGRQVPPMPRFTTRVTLLVEHEELEPVDLLSMAERCTMRKSNDDDSKSTSHKKRMPRVYCHIADGGEY